MYWSSTTEGMRGKSVRDNTCWFQVCLLGGGKVKITDYKGDHLSMDEAGERKAIKLIRGTKSPHSEFELKYKNDKLFFQAFNGMLLCRIWYGGDKNTIEAMTVSDDYHCLFDRIGNDV
ncbi:hypothetical protein NDU88_001223 [Pleurodeles waltl]|uniref:Uncharacterized protein n=1 Tax=Pleurodeles waltl TaxID=8319 RepID=A0AAV7Q317_PLEWA|nr:hypothetical protein NDU88_001223 [Pleurodeles waltl]